MRGSRLVNPLCWLDVLDLIGHRVRVNRPVLDANLEAIIQERQRVDHPVLIVPLRIVFAGVRPAALSPVAR